MFKNIFFIIIVESFEDNNAWLITIHKVTTRINFIESLSMLKQVYDNDSQNDIYWPKGNVVIIRNSAASSRVEKSQGLNP